MTLLALGWLSVAASTIVSTVQLWRDRPETLRQWLYTAEVTVFTLGWLVLPIAVAGAYPWRVALAQGLGLLFAAIVCRLHALGEPVERWGPDTIEVDL